jgi:gliding motility-associated-like protein
MSEKENKFEDIFKDSFEEFEPEVNPSVWKNIQTGLKGAGIGVLIKGLINKLGSNAVVAIVSSAATVLGTVVVMNWTGSAEKPKEETNTTTPKVKIETSPPAKVEEIKDFLSDKNAVTNKKETAAKEENTAVKEVEAAKNTVVKKDKKELESVINSLSGQTIASISASNVGGAVPLIVSVSNDGSGKINKWDFGDGKKESGANPVHVYDVPGIYTISLTSISADGKTATDEITVEVTGNSSILNSMDEISFSPNGDTIQDICRFQSKNIIDMSVVIFDKQSTIVKSINTKNGVEGQWDGKDMKGKPAKEGTYFYILNALGADGKKYNKKGKINLTR